jgi:AcrR family transcriptional regulator
MSRSKAFIWRISFRKKRIVPLDEDGFEHEIDHCSINFLNTVQFHGDLMGRRSDHTRDELRTLFVEEGGRQLAEAGLMRFSARDVAKRVGYSVGTLYNVFGSYDELMLAINARTLAAWMAHQTLRLEQVAGGDRVAALVRGYFEFAEANPKAWIAIFEYNLTGDAAAPAWYQAEVATAMSLVTSEIAVALPDLPPRRLAALTRSLIATVHGHVAFAIFRTFNMLGEAAPVDAALARVKEALAAAGAEAG